MRTIGNSVYTSRLVPSFISLNNPTGYIQIITSTGSQPDLEAGTDRAIVGGHHSIGTSAFIRSFFGLPSCLVLCCIAASSIRSVAPNSNRTSYDRSVARWPSINGHRTSDSIKNDKTRGEEPNQSNELNPALSIIGYNLFVFSVGL